MSSVSLTCEETPLAWLPTVKPEELMPCSNCGIRIHVPGAGSLQVLTRRVGGGVGDGVTIEENNGIGADYRGQRYTYKEAVLHVPGLHIFPGQTKPYPAEYHVHMSTYSKPNRNITVVIPVSHHVKEGPGNAYFAAMAARPDPSAKRPLLSTILPTDVDIYQYLGPDIRGRTKDKAKGKSADQCDVFESEWQFLLVSQVASIRAADLERIPRQGSLSTDPRDLPSPGIAPTQKLSRDRFLKGVVLARPGILGATDKSKDKKPPAECKDTNKEKGSDTDKPKPEEDPATQKRIAAAQASADAQAEAWVNRSIGFFSMLLGLLLADQVIRFVLWRPLFASDSSMPSIRLKWIFYIVLSLFGAAYFDALDQSLRSIIG